MRLHRHNPQAGQEVAVDLSVALYRRLSGARPRSDESFDDRNGTRPSTAAIALDERASLLDVLLTDMQSDRRRRSLTVGMSPARIRFTISGFLAWIAFAVSTVE